MADSAEQAQDGLDSGNGTDVQELFEQAEQAIEDFVATLGTLAEKVESLQPVADEVSSDAIDELSESIHALTEHAPTVGNELKQADQLITDVLHGTISSINDHAQAVGAHTASTVARISDEERDLDASFSTLHAGLGDALTLISGSYNEHLQALEAAQRELTDQLRQQYDDRLSSGADQIVSAVGQFSASAEEITKQLIGLLAQAVMGLADAVEESVRQAESERAPAQMALDSVKIVLDPLMEEVGRVKDLAGSVGISI